MPDFERVQKSLNGDDVKVHASRVLRVMNNAIDKLKIAICLPTFLRNDSFWLRKYMKNDEVDFIQVTCEKYTHNTPSQHSRMPKSNSVAHPRMALALDMIWNNMEMRKLALENHKDLADSRALPLIDSIHSLTQLTETKLEQTAKEERSSREQLRSAWYENAEMRITISELTTKIEKQREEDENKIAQSLQLVSSHENKIHSYMQTLKRTLKEGVENSEKTMFTEATTSVAHQANLSNDTKNITNQYEAVLSQHLNVEKKLRANRLKVETQLANWLTKYDTDMGERQAEFEYIEACYNRQKESMDLLRVAIEEQEAEYEALWTEKLEEGLAIFRVNRAARIIQRFWRKYRPKKTSKKRGKGGKKKSKKRK